MFYLDDLRLAEFRHSLSESQRIPEDKGEPECQMSVKPQRAEGSDGSGIPGRGHVAHGGTASKCLLSINPFSIPALAPQTFCYSQVGIATITERTLLFFSESKPLVFRVYITIREIDPHIVA